MTSANVVIGEFLAKIFPGRAIGETDDIFDSGLVTSLLALQLVNFIETRFGIRVADEDLERRNFRTIAAMTALVAKYQA
jgi:methoxymalonate biosynthesis acyl carrier protein